MNQIVSVPSKIQENPFESMLLRFERASELLGLSQEAHDVLKSPAKQVIVSLPWIRVLSKFLKAIG